MTTPADAKYDAPVHTVNGQDFYIGLFEMQPEQWPDILTPKLLHKVDGEWVVAKEYQTLWDDTPNIYNPEQMVGSILRRFNPVIEQLSGEPLTWNQKVAEIIRFRLAVDEGKIVLLPKE